VKITPSSIPDVLLVEPTVFGDARGFFLETWNARRFADAGITADFVQDNHSRSRQWSIRGLHYQITHAQGKLVRCVSGEIADVAVDLRRSSASFGRHVLTVLSADDHKQVWVPPGFAHGFCVLSESADVLYKATAYYAPEHERVIAWDDPDLAIPWPLPTGTTPSLSERDARGGRFAEAEVYV
jgi:dTDP-4-dehydrorhamnose 3,5-epimerase